jgi:hypothetical protein
MPSLIVLFSFRLAGILGVLSALTGWDGLIVAPLHAQLYAQTTLSQTSIDQGWTPLAVLVPTPGADHATFEVPSNRRSSSSAKLLISDVLLQVLDGPMFVRQMRVTRGRETVEIPIRRAYGPGDQIGPYTFAAGDAVSRIVVDLQPDRQSNARIAVFVPGALAGAVAAVLAPAPQGVPATLDGLSPIGTITLNESSAAGMGSAFGTPAGGKPSFRIGAQRGRLTHLALYVQRGTLTLRGLRIVYATGETQDIALERQLTEGQATPLILVEREGFIAEVQYNVSASTPRANITLYGALAEGWTGEAGESKTYTAGWVLLALQRPSQEALLREARVTADVGRFKKLRFTAREGSASLSSVTVVFDDGSRATISIGQNLAKDQTSQPIKLEDAGGGRRIEAIIFPPASKSAIKRDSYVEVWGQN